MEQMEIKISEPTLTIYRGGVFPDKKYTCEMRGWQAISTIEVTGKRIWAAWMAGGVTEPDPDNYIILSFSDDGGKTWLDPFITIDNSSPLSRGRDPVLWLSPDGVLWFFYGFYQLKYTYAVKIVNPQVDSESMIIGKPEVKFTDGVIINKPIVTADGRWLCMFDPREENRQTNCCLQSDDCGESWKIIGTLHTDSTHKDWQEGHLIEKRGGVLWALLRIENGYNGGIEQCFSFDGGITWTNAEYNLGYPFYGPGSKFCMRTLKSGKILFVNNNSSDKMRMNMSAYLSGDGGATWKALLLDGRNGCAYPDIAEDDDGNIYVIFDFGRKDRHEIRLCKFREEDVENGGFFSDNSINMRAISKDLRYKDIVSAYAVSEKKVCVVDEDNRKHFLFGSFCDRIINNRRYKYFSAESELDELNLSDGKNLLLIKSSDQVGEQKIFIGEHSI